MKNKILTNALIEEELLLEKITKEQKKAGREAMAEKALEPIDKLREYLIEKWNKEKITKEQLIQKIIEFKRFNSVKKVVDEYVKETFGNSPSVNKYLKDIFGKGTSYPVVAYAKNGVADEGEIPNVFLKLGGQKNTPEFNLQSKKPEIIKILNKYVALHELGHIFNYFKHFVENGEIKKITPSDIAFEKGDYKGLLDSEGKANAYALDNMSKDDRMELLKNSSIKRKTLDRAKDKVERIMSGQGGKVEQLDFYRAGTEKHSKTIKDTLKSLDRMEKFKEKIIKNKKEINNKFIGEMYYFDNNVLYCDLYLSNENLNKLKKLPYYFDNETLDESLIITFKENSVMDRFNKIREVKLSEENPIFNY